MPDRAAVEQFHNSLEGPLVLSEDVDFDEIRAAWNGMIGRRPQLIARCRCSQDVVSTVNFVRDQRLSISMRCGGQSVTDKSVCEEDLMVDLSLGNGVTIDPEAGAARIEAGVKLVVLDVATQECGLATTAGMVSDTGVGGLTPGGGVGYLARRFGLAVGNLLGAEGVTAAGELDVTE